MRSGGEPGQSIAAQGDRGSAPSFTDAFRFWLKLGFISFGGSAGQIAIMQHELVEKRKWISQERFLHALNYCMLLPGPEATQLAIYIGWLLHRTAGGVVAGVLFVLPASLLLAALSWIYVALGSSPWIAALFYGLKPAVVAIVLAALVRIGRKALKNGVMWSIAGLAFLAIYFMHVPYPFIVIAAAFIGIVGGTIQRERFLVVGSVSGAEAGGTAVLADHDRPPPHTVPSLAKAVRVVCLWVPVWWSPVLLAYLLLGSSSVLFQEGIFFSKAALVTFGGAYAVLPYVAQQAVENFHWLTAQQMLDGLGLAETTPGPLIIVLQFVGFVAAWNRPGSLSPLVAAMLGAFVTTWTTFTPCFLWIFLGGPHIEQLRGNERISTALSGVTAAVVGVVLNLTVWFGLSVIYPASAHIDWFALLLAVMAFILMTRRDWGVVSVVAVSALLGVARFMFP